MTLHAIRFEPPERGSSVPLEIYSKALERMATGLRSVRHTVARRLAGVFSFAPGEADRFVVLRVEPLQKGSLAVPVRVGPINTLPLYPDLEEKFWALADGIIGSAIVGTDNTLSITAADEFAAAGEIAQESGYGLSISTMEQKPRGGRKKPASVWKKNIDVISAAEPLRLYAEKRRKLVSEATIHIIGEVIELSAKPPGFKLDTPTNGRIRVSCSSALLMEVKAAFNAFVLLECTAEVGSEDVPREIVAQKISPLKTTRTIKKDWEKTRGTHDGPEIWRGTEAEEYIKELRHRRSS